MSSGHFFEGSSHMQFYGGQSFTNANKIINKYYYNYPALCSESEAGWSDYWRDDDQWLTLYSGQRLRLIDICDILILHEVSSETLCISVKLKVMNPFRNSTGRAMKIQKRVQSAEIVPGFGDRRFTVVSLEPEDNGDVEKIRMVLEPLYEVALYRRVWITQLFGVGRSMTPMLIYHDEVVDVEAILGQYEETPIVYNYLLYRFIHSVSDMLNDGILQKLSLPLLMKSCSWMFNLRTHLFQYDIINTALSDQEGQMGYSDPLLPLPHNCHPLLDSKEIIQAFPTFPQIFSLFREYHHIPSRHHVCLTFGTVVDRRKPGILAYFPSVLSPVWSCTLPIGNLDIIAKYSKSVTSLVDLTFVKDKHNWKLDILFSLRLPPDELSTACLVQLFSFYKDHNTIDFKELVFFDDIGFELTGTFMSDPSTCNPPKYLHVPPLSPKWINNMPRFCWPSNRQLFYWSFDCSGRMKIPKEKWKQYGVPELQLEEYFGTKWEKPKYKVVQEYFLLNNYDSELGGQKFAKDHGYPILVKGDPHI